jgi:phospholipid-binding lipoprotein MlaA
VVNTTVGVAGFIDVATHKMEIKKYEEDLGQTFGLWGIGPGFYINWPLLGPSTLRDTVGFVGDAFLYPVSFIIEPSGYTLAINAFDIVNQTSLRIGDYEDLKKAAFDPYIALRDAYYQNRRSKIEE